MPLIQSLPAGTTCKITKVGGEANAARRACELGLVPGTMCTIIRKAPFSGPIEIATATAHLGIRPSDGLLIYVDVIHSTENAAA